MVDLYLPLLPTYSNTYVNYSNLTCQLLTILHCKIKHGNDVNFFLFDPPSSRFYWLISVGSSRTGWLSGLVVLLTMWGSFEKVCFRNSHLPPSCVLDSTSLSFDPSNVSRGPQQGPGVVKVPFPTQFVRSWPGESGAWRPYDGRTLGYYECL